MENIIKNLAITMCLLLSFSTLAQVKVLVLGDSLSEGYGVGKEYSYVTLIQNRLDKEKVNIKITNGSISGSTTSSLSSRLRWYLKTKPDYVIVALGANDGLRGVDISTIEKNLKSGIDEIKKVNATALLFPMLLPPNYGEVYRKGFEKVFTDIIKQSNLEKLPFLLDGVAGERSLNQSDGIHPNIKGHDLAS